MVTLPADDTYSIVVDAGSTYTGQTTVTLYNVPADPTAALTSGNPGTLMTTTPACASSQPSRYAKNPPRLNPAAYVRA